MEEHPERDRLTEWMTCQMMHRMLFAADLSRELPAAWRQAFELTGDWPSDARLILVDAWRTNAVLVWAERMGRIYEGGEFS